jgi:hypothetical protein
MFNSKITDFETKTLTEIHCQTVVDAQKATIAAESAYEDLLEKVSLSDSGYVNPVELFEMKSLMSKAGYCPAWPIATIANATGQR